MISFFKYTDNKEGNIAIGKLPQNMISILENVNIHIPDKDITKCTYHNWCDNMLPTIKKDIDLIKNDPYWNSYYYWNSNGPYYAANIEKKSIT